MVIFYLTENRKYLFLFLFLAFQYLLFIFLNNFYLLSTKYHDTKAKSCYAKTYLAIILILRAASYTTKTTV